MLLLVIHFYLLPFSRDQTLIQFILLLMESLQKSFFTIYGLENGSRAVVGNPWRGGSVPGSGSNLARIRIPFIGDGSQPPPISKSGYTGHSMVRILDMVAQNMVRVHEGKTGIL